MGVEEDDVWKKLAENVKKGARRQRDGEQAGELEKMLTLLDNLFFKMESETGLKTALSERECQNRGGCSRRSR
jgi:hypothetical protein